MRTSADAEQVVAQVGLLARRAGAGAGTAGGGEGGGAPALPELPGLPTGRLERLRRRDHRRRGRRGAGAGRPARRACPRSWPHWSTSPATPPRAAAETGTDVVRHDVPVRASSDVSLLGGLITVEAVHTRVTTASDGSDGHAPRAAGAVGTLRIAGNAFAIGADGIEAAGQQAPIPGLPDDPAKALAELGIAAGGAEAGARPERRRVQRAGRRASGSTSTPTSCAASSTPLPLGDIIGALPDEAQELKSLLSAAPGCRRGSCSPSATPAPPPTPCRRSRSRTTRRTRRRRRCDGRRRRRGRRRGPGGARRPLAPGAPARHRAPRPTADGDLTGAAPMGSGLPPLTSIPGALTVGGIAPGRRRRHLAAQDRRDRPRRRRLLSARPRQRPARPPKGLIR